MNHQLQVTDEEDGSEEEEEEEEEFFQESGIENLQSHYQNQHFQQLPQPLCQKPAKWANFTACEQELSRMTRRKKPKRAKTDVIEVHGSRVIRATGRKDRHSKVSTSKGPKDRRVRLSPNTAIQFYDVQDRLGYDRPSKAIDWLIKEAKAAIDALGESPNNWHCTKLNSRMQFSFDQEQSPRFSQENRGVSNTQCRVVQDNQQEVNYDIPIQNFNLFSSPDGSKNPFLSEFQSYPNGHFLNFQSLHDDTILSPSNHQGNFLTTTSIPLNSNSNMEMGRFRRSLNENITISNSRNGEVGEDSSLNILAHHFPSVLSQNQVISHREPLQSSFFPLTRDPLSTQHQTLSYGFGTNDGFSGVIPSAPRIQGEDEQGTLFSAS